MLSLILGLAGMTATITAADAAGPETVIRSASSTSAPLSPAQMQAAQVLDAATNVAPLRTIGRGKSAAWAGASGAGPRGAGELADEQAAPYGAHGRIFFRKPEGEGLFSCSGTVVRSLRRNLVLTAGHCVYDATLDDFNQQIVFVPAYRDGQAPLGQYAATVRFAPLGWIRDGNSAYDFAAFQVAETVEETVGGGRPLYFNLPAQRLKRLSIYGYPALPADRYNGERPIVCAAAYSQAAKVGAGPLSLVASPCDMQQGSSGGGWINPAGYLVSVVSHGYCDSNPSLCGYIAGPHLGAAALSLYQRAGGSVKPAARFVRAPRGATRARRPSFTFQAEGSTAITFQCRVDRRAFKRCGNRIRVARLQPGRHLFRVRATDQAGRSVVIRRNFRVMGKRARTRR